MSLRCVIAKFYASHKLWIDKLYDFKVISKNDLTINRLFVSDFKKLRT